MIQNAIETNQTLIRSNQHQLKLNYPAQQVFVDGDPIRLAQVVANLINNAAKYTPEKGVIEITVSQRDDVATISVKDNGLGILKICCPTSSTCLLKLTSIWIVPKAGLGLD